MRVPVEWLARVRRRRPARHGARGAPDDDRHEGRGASTTTASARSSTSSSARCCSAEQHPDADRLRVCQVDVGDGASRRRSSAARRTWPPARPSPSRGRAPSCPTARSSRRPSCAASESDGMILAEDELGDRHRPRRDHGARRRAGRRHAAGRRAADRRPTCSSSRSRPTGPTAWASTASPARSTPPPARALAPPPWADDLGSAGDVAGAQVVVDAPDLCPRFTARVFEDVTIGPSPAVAEGAPDGRRAAPDQQRRRHHQLRDAADRPAAARLRPRPRRRRRGSTCAARATASRSPRSTASRARSTPTCSSSTTPTGRRRSPASWAARAPRSHAGTTRVLMEVATWDGPNIHAHVAEARRCAARPAGASRRAWRPSRRSRRRSSPRGSCSS